MLNDDSMKNAGEWTRDDLPSVERRVDRTSFVLDAVVDHLNEHHPKPGESFVVMLEDTHRAQRERDAAVARADQLRDERDDAVQSCMAVGSERDEWKARALDAEHYAQAASASNRDNADRASRAERERDAAVARAEAAERELARANDELDRVRDDDPVVYAIRESDIAAVELRRSDLGTYTADGEFVAVDDADQAGHLAREYMTKAVRRFAVQCAIEAEPTVDPVEDVALIISAGMFHKESSPELVREIAQEVVDYLKGENDD